MKNRRPYRPSPALILATVALVAALVGTAVAGPPATNSKLSRSKVKRIADKRINKKAPGLSVRHANTSDALDELSVVAKGTIAGPGTVADDACGGDNKQVPGVQTGDHVILTPPEGWQTHEVTLMPFVSAPGLLEYTMCNKSGGTGTNFSEDVNFLVLR